MLNHTIANPKGKYYSEGKGGSQRAPMNGNINLGKGKTPGKFGQGKPRTRAMWPVTREATP